jgi:hypothetical protein
MLNSSVQCYTQTMAVPWFQINAPKSNLSINNPELWSEKHFSINMWLKTPWMAYDVDTVRLCVSYPFVYLFDHQISSNEFILLCFSFRSGISKSFQERHIYVGWLRY